MNIGVLIQAVPLIVESYKLIKEANESKQDFSIRSAAYHEEDVELLRKNRKIVEGSVINVLAKGLANIGLVLYGGVSILGMTGELAKFAAEGGVRFLSGVSAIPGVGQLAMVLGTGFYTAMAIYEMTRKNPYHSQTPEHKLFERERRVAIGTQLLNAAICFGLAALAVVAGPIAPAASLGVFAASSAIYFAGAQYREYLHTKYEHLAQEKEDLEFRQAFKADHKDDYLNKIENTSDHRLRLPQELTAQKGLGGSYQKNERNSSPSPARSKPKPQ